MSSEAPDVSRGTPGPTGETLERLRHLAYVVLPPSLGRRRRARLAGALAQRAAGTDGYAAARDRVVTSALHIGPRRLGISALGGRPGAGGGDPAGLAARRLAGFVPAARAAYALHRLEGVPGPDTVAALRAAGVRDPETALALAQRTDLDPAAVRAITVPVRGDAARPRLVTAGAAALVLGVAAPVIAASTGDDGGDRGDVPASRQTGTDAGPAGRTTTGTAPAGRGTAATKPPTATAVRPGTAAAAAVRRDLARALARLDAELAAPRSPAEATRLRQLRAAVVAEQRRLAR